MAHRKAKRRTHVRDNEQEDAKIPKSMVIQIGHHETGKSIHQLVLDIRMAMAPHTAIRLKERRSNKLRDYLSMCGPLGVTHLLLFSRSSSGNSTLRICRTPRGPTLNFRIESYSLCKDVRNSLRNPKSLGSEYITPPLLVLNGFSSSDRSKPEEMLITSMFQNMFPPINAQTVNLSSIKRIILLYKDANTGFIEFRHFSIDSKIVNDTSKSVKKLIRATKNVHKRIPNLSSLKDISDFVLDPYAADYTSESEVEEDATVEMIKPTELNETSTEDNEIQNAVDSLQNKVTTQKRAIKLTEIGPRMRLRLIKIEEGVCEGKILYHSIVHKSKQEAQELEKRHEIRKLEKSKRKAEQDKHVQEKLNKKLAKKEKRAKRTSLNQENNSDSEANSDDSDDSENSDDNDTATDGEYSDDQTNYSDVEMTNNSDNDSIE